MASGIVVLDLDGTIWDSHPWYAQVAGRGDPLRVSHALTQLETGMPVAKVLRAVGYTKASFRSVCRSGTPPLRCFPGIVEALGYLKDSGMALGVATNLPAWIAEPMADAAGIEPFLGTLVDYTATSRHKPYPDPLIEAMDRLKGDSTSSAWYVGDADSDATAARAAGLLFAWASWGTASEAPDGTSLVLGEPADLVNLAALRSEESEQAIQARVRK